MSLSSGASGGKGVDANPVETYDSGDEWDIGVGNLIIDLDADLEKDQQKLEMSGSKEVGLPAPNAVATLPENIKFVTPVPGPQSKESKSKSKRNKSSKDSGKAAPGSSLFTPSEGTSGKKEVQGRPGDGVNSSGLVAAIAPKGSEKSAKASRSVANSKKEKEVGSSKSKKERSEGVGAPAEKEPSVLQPLALAVRVGQYDGGQGSEPVAAAEQLGSIAIDTGSALNPLGVKTELEDGDNECRQLKKVKSEKMESPVSTPAVLPLHLLVPVVNSDISSPCEQIMVRTRSVGVNTCDVALATEPECLGPCEPGTSVNLEGIVWQETEDGMLVVNVTWRNKTYVGTLLDCTQHDWAPPRFCDSPTSDLEMRNGRGRGKRMRPNSNPPMNESTAASDSKGTSNSSKTRAGANSKGRRGSQNSSEHRLPPTGTSEDVKASLSSVTKRKSKPLSDMEVNSSSEDSKGSKRVRTNSMGSAATPLVAAVAAAAAAATTTIKVEPAILDRNCPSPILIDCPHPNCSKKYKHINGLKYHQAHAHTDDDSKPEADGDSEYGEESSLPADLGSCNGASGSQKGSLSPARSTTPKGRLIEPHSPSPSSKFNPKAACKKKLGGEGDPDSGALSNDGSEDGPLVADETSNDGFESIEKRSSDKEKAKKPVSVKPEKISSKSIKSARPIAPAIPPQIYTFQTATFTATSPGSSTGLTTTVVQAVANSAQLKPIQPKPTVMGEPFTVSPALTPVKDKKKKDKKKKESKETESPLTPGKVCRAEEGKSPFRGEPSDLGAKGESLLNGSSDPHQSRLASIKAEADKIYSFTDNAPSPSIGGASRLDSAAPAQPMTPLHVVTQNGAEASSVKTNSPAYSDISDAGEDGEGKLDSVKTKDPEQLTKEGAKKALFPSQPQNKDSPYYQGFEAYYSPGYAQSSPGPINSNSQTTLDSQALKLKKDEEPPSPEVKVKNEACEEKKADLGPSSQQPSVIQQRSNMYMQSLYYNQYAYVPPYGYSEQGYHAHLLSTNPTYRQQYEDQQKQRQSLEQQQQRVMDKKIELGLKEREVALKEEWKQKPSLPPTLTKAPSLTDLVKSGLSKAKDQGSDVAKSVIIPKLENSSKLQGQTAEGLKGKLSESLLGKETAEPKAGLDCGRQAEVDPVLWYSQEAEPRMWTYVYPAKYSDIKTEDERWKEERDRKLKEERSRSKEPLAKEDGKESTSSDCKVPSSEESRLVGKEARPSAHVPVSSPLSQHQSYIPYMHGYSYSQAYDPNHPSYRGMPTVMMQNYPGSYLPSSYSFSPYGSKSSGSEESEKSRASPSIGCKSSSESKALDILQQHASHYKSKSPTRLMSTHHHHHHLGYSLLPAQYNLPYATGLSSTAIVASQQGSAPSLYPPPRR
ncbi:zinc finger protein 609 isoform X2 [Rhineura floridana]|uniref:zinc finger protein 609 isoform X2 n=1 Tax=Rhineura floridana TaxID=261503 RepID=UPI002AC8156C|nr:zinc finger protein 609 isoform X2 [Rhineura floridana]